MSSSEFATNPDDCVSVSGYCFSLGSGIVSWSSRKQSCLTLSSCEVEFVAACNASHEAMWFQTLLSLLEFPQPQLSLISINNQGALDVLYNPTSHSRTKHFDLPLLFAHRCATVNKSSPFNGFQVMTWWQTFSQNLFLNLCIHGSHNFLVSLNSLSFPSLSVILSPFVSWRSVENCYKHMTSFPLHFTYFTFCCVPSFFYPQLFILFYKEHLGLH